MPPEDALPASQRHEPIETGPYVLRNLLEDVPLSADGDHESIRINCVEFLGKFGFFP